MKKIVVFSDSHGNPSPMLRALERESPDIVIHLGDGEGDLRAVRRRFPDIELCSVRGNCDLRSAAPLLLRRTVENVRIFAVHGHEYGVKYDRTMTKLRYAGLEADANVVLFGHTHRAFQDRSLGMDVMNPGSIGYSGSYGVITVDGRDAVLELRRVEGE